MTVSDKRFYKKKKNINRQFQHLSCKVSLSFPLKNHTALGLRGTTPAQVYLRLLVKVSKNSGKIEGARKSSKTGGKALKNTRVFGNQMITPKLDKVQRKTVILILVHLCDKLLILFSENIPANLRACQTIL